MGSIYDDRGNYQGSVRSSGEIYDEYGNYLGRITQDGEIYDASGTYLGSIWSNGYIYIAGTYIGLIDESGNVYKDGSYVGHIDGLKKNKIDSGKQTGGSTANQKTDYNKQRSSSERKSHINIPTPSVGEDGCLPTLIVGTLLFVGIIYVAVYAIVIAAIIGLAVGCIALVGWIFYMIVGAATEGRFKENPNAKVISGIIATVIVLGTFAILHSTGSFDKLAGSGTTSSGGTYGGGYEEGSDGSYEGETDGGYEGETDGGYEGETDSGYEGETDGGYEGETDGGYEEETDGGYEEGSGLGDDYDYILPYSDSEYLTENDLDGMTSDELRLARNEIYARYGRRFNDESLQRYFDDCSWYTGTIDPEDFDEDVLNQYEKKNLELIVNYEKK